jgi:hypothetical protein
MEYVRSTLPPNPHGRHPGVFALAIGRTSAAAESEMSAVVERVPAQFWGSTTTVA